MGLILTFAIACVILLAGVCLAVYFAWLRHPPTIEVKLPPFAPIWNVHVNMPDRVRVQYQQIPPDFTPPSDEPMPSDVFDYISEESEPHARQYRLRHARTLKQELGDWPAVLQRLKREDDTTT